jgi:transposase, IS5 family
MAQRRQSIWQSRYLGIRTMSRSIAVSASSADGRPQMRPYEGRRLRQGLLDKSNTASGVWADTAYRSVANETFLTKNGFVSHIHRKKPKGRAMPETIRRANNAKSKIRARVEYVFAQQKDRMGLFIRTIGIARATTKIGMANLVYNIKRLIFLRRVAIA